jgi:predicted DNA binding CopG/RHH family protein
VPDGELIRLAAGASAGVSEQETLPLSSELIDKIRTLREIKKVSAQKLADLMVEQGYQVSRSMIANYEAKRVASIAIDYVAHAAQALGIPFVTLLVEPVQCPACKGSPPEGFTCNTCGGA